MRKTEKLWNSSCEKSLGIFRKTSIKLIGRLTLFLFWGLLCPKPDRLLKSRSKHRCLRFGKGKFVFLLLTILSMIKMISLPKQSSWHKKGWKSYKRNWITRIRRLSNQRKKSFLLVSKVGLTLLYPSFRHLSLELRIISGRKFPSLFLLSKQRKKITKCLWILSAKNPKLKGLCVLQDPLKSKKNQKNKRS